MSRCLNTQRPGPPVLPDSRAQFGSAPTGPGPVALCPAHHAPSVLSLATCRVRVPVPCRRDSKPKLRQAGGAVAAAAGETVLTARALRGPRTASSRSPLPPSVAGPYLARARGLPRLGSVSGKPGEVSEKTRTGQLGLGPAPKSSQGLAVSRMRKPVTHGLPRSTTLSACSRSFWMPLLGPFSDFISGLVPSRLLPTAFCSCPRPLQPGPPPNPPLPSLPAPPPCPSHPANPPRPSSYATSSRKPSSTPVRSSLIPQALLL